MKKKTIDFYYDKKFASGYAGSPYIYLLKEGSIKGLIKLISQRYGDIYDNHTTKEIALKFFKDGEWLLLKEEKPKTIAQLVSHFDEQLDSIDVPYDVMRLLGVNKISIIPGEVSLGDELDYGTPEEVLEAIKWLKKQLKL